MPTCPTPAPGPNNFALYGPEQRCLEGGELAPFSRRRLDHIDSNGTLDSTAVVISNPDECWAYCSTYGTHPAPFFFNWKIETNQVIAQTMRCRYNFCIALP